MVKMKRVKSQTCGVTLWRISLCLQKRLVVSPSSKICRIKPIFMVLSVDKL
jgi:hypothetical protein